MNRSPSSLQSVQFCLLGLFSDGPLLKPMGPLRSKFAILLISLTVGLVQIPTTVQAQEILDNPRSIDVEIRSGMTEADLLEQFGQPTRKLEDKVSLQATWYYRDTVVFLANGKVTAWSNANASNRSLASLSARSSSKAVSSSEIRSSRWSNAWTPPEPNAVDHTADELINELGSR